MSIATANFSIMPPAPWENERFRGWSPTDPQTKPLTDEPMKLLSPTPSITGWSPMTNPERTGVYDAQLPPWLAALGIGIAAVGTVVLAAKFGPALLKSHSPAANIAKVGIGVAAALGAAAILASCSGSKDLIVKFATQPDLTGVPENQVYNVLRAHHERFAPAVVAELEALKTEGKVKSYSPVIGSNGFVITVASGKDAEVKQRLAAIPDVGSVDSASLQ